MWGELEEELDPKCPECKENHIRTRCGGSCRRTMCVKNPHVRFYCPKCHEVHCGWRRHGKWIVPPHYRVDVDGILERNGARFLGKDNRPCVGGDVDYSKDRAP